MSDLIEYETAVEREFLQAYCDFTVSNWSQYNGGGGRVQRWVNSTWNRWVFARLMVGTTLAPPPFSQRFDSWGHIADAKYLAPRRA